MVGAGLIGAGVARLAIERGDDVIVATRSAAPVEGAESIALQAGDGLAFEHAAQGADAIVLCTNPPYPAWVAEWPPVFAAAIGAAASSGALLVIMGNLYAYGAPSDRASGVMTEHSPLATTETKGIVRRDGWLSALAAERRGEIRAVEVRASDYVGPGAGATSHLGSGFFAPLLRSRTARVVGDPDAPHSWSYLPDIHATLLAAVDHPDLTGRAWHVPSGAPLSRTTIAGQVDLVAGTHGRVAAYPPWLLRAMGAVSPMMREVSASSYQFRAPFVIDSAETEAALGVRATPWDEVLRATVASYRG